MHTRLRAFRASLLILLIIVFALFCPGLPWSDYFRYTLHRTAIKAEMKLSSLRGYEPRLVSLAGDCGIPGAQVQALNSHSGWATLADNQGKFLLPDVMWYSGASYDLIVSSDGNKGRKIRVSAPETPPPTGIVLTGQLAPWGKVEPLEELIGIRSTSSEEYDFDNRDYYIGVYENLTANARSDDQKVDAVNNYIAEKLNYKETQWDIGSPRRIIERGSQYCGHLSVTLATLLSVAYPTRILDLSDGGSPPNTHVVVEVFYQGQWHLYDPTFGVKHKNKDSKVASYKELRLDSSLISKDIFDTYRQKYPKASLEWMQGVYSSGFHHVYVFNFDCSQYSHAWWAYQNGLSYVPSGSSIWLAAAGIRPGTRVTFHIRKQGTIADELMFTTRTSGTADCVLDQELSPPIDLEPAVYDVFVDLRDGNVSGATANTPIGINAWRLGVKLEVR